MASFWLIIQNNKTGMNGNYYAELIEKLRRILPIRRPGHLRKKPILLIDNAPIHKAQPVIIALNKFGFELLDHPPYSPDLAPSD